MGRMRIVRLIPTTVVSPAGDVDPATGALINVVCLTAEDQ